RWDAGKFKLAAFAGDGGGVEAHHSAIAAGRREQDGGALLRSSFGIDFALDHRAARADHDIEDRVGAGADLHLFGQDVFLAEAHGLEISAAWDGSDADIPNARRNLLEKEVALGSGRRGDIAVRATRIARNKSHLEVLKLFGALALHADL